MIIYCDFGSLVGKTLTSIDNLKDEELVFTTDSGEVYKLYHTQDCCESVIIEDICGDISDLIGSPILEAEEVVSEQNSVPHGWQGSGLYDDSFTWTFYKLGTRNGSVTIRWLGQSNGYYSESVDFGLVSKGD